MTLLLAAFIISASLSTAFWAATTKEAWVLGLLTGAAIPEVVRRWRRG